MTDTLKFELMLQPEVFQKRTEQGDIYARTSIHNWGLNFGPQHPSAHGVLRLILELNGEIVVRADPHIGLLHRGSEKLMESKNLAQGLPYLDRLYYVSMMAQEHTYSNMIERVSGTIITERASDIRVLTLEITRLLNHLMSLTTHAMDVGALTPFLWAFEEREKLMEIYERLSGARLHANYIRPGGVAWDLPFGIIRSIKDFIKNFRTCIIEMEELLTLNRIWQQRLSGVGVVSLQQAMSLGFSGVMMRGSGGFWDLRKTTPYEGYEWIDFKVAVGSQGDCYDRYLCRVEEMRQSLQILTSTIENIRAGPVRVSGHGGKIKPSREEMKTGMESLIQHFLHHTTNLILPSIETYLGTEAPKGEFGVFLASNNSNTPSRVKFRAPGYYHLQGMKFLASQHLLADVVTIIGTLYIVFGEVDR